MLPTALHSPAYIGFELLVNETVHEPLFYNKQLANQLINYTGSPSVI